MLPALACDRPPFTRVIGLLAALLAAGADRRLSWFGMILDPRMLRVITCSWSSLEPGADLGVGSWSSVCLLCLCFLACDRPHARVSSSRMPRPQAESSIMRAVGFACISGRAPSSRRRGLCKQLNRLFRRRPSSLSLCIVSLIFVLGDRFEGAAEFSLRRLRQRDARGVADGSGASRRFRIVVSLACNNELAHVS